MDHNNLYDNTTLACSKIITNNYSTSFSLGIKTLDRKFRDPVYSIYGFVRFADEIVDTFHGHDKEKLLTRFKNETFLAIEEKISLNPVLHAFQMVVNKYHIEKELIEAFLKSMEMDLDNKTHDKVSYDEYIYGSAEVVGLMCLRVFTEGDDLLYQSLKAPAKKLGAAFQKVNFLRDIKSDYNDRGRIYFPDVDFTTFKNDEKKSIEADIEKDFSDALIGINKLPSGAKKGVYLAFIYYTKLFDKIKKMPASKILNGRIRLPDTRKIMLLIPALIKNSFNFS